MKFDFTLGVVAKKAAPRRRSTYLPAKRLPVIVIAALLSYYASASTCIPLTR
jgi:hypothetical protein